MTNKSRSSSNTQNKNNTGMNKLKMEVANEIGVDLNDGRNLTSAEAGSVGGEMVRRMIKDQKDKMSGSSN